MLGTYPASLFCDTSPDRCCQPTQPFLTEHQQLRKKIKIKTQAKLDRTRQQECRLNPLSILLLISKLATPTWDLKTYGADKQFRADNRECATGRHRKSVGGLTDLDQAPRPATPRHYANGDGGLAFDEGQRRGAHDGPREIKVNDQAHTSRHVTGK